jgi:hypothetical protein
MARLARAALLALALLAVSLSAASGAGPTLGGRLSPVPLVYEHDQAVNVTSLATIPVTVSLSVDGAGWQLAADRLTLQPGERQSVAVTAAGNDPATLSVRFLPVDPVTGSETSALVLQGTLRHATLLESVPWLLVLLLALLAFLVGFRLLQWARRRSA